MSKKIEFDYDNEHYILEYNRDAIKVMEQNGFLADEFLKKPMTMIDLAFQGLFLKNHKKISPDRIREIFDHFKDKQALNRMLITMVDEAYDVLFEDNKEDEEKNIDWKIV